jgi:hypothetical protein
MFLLYPSVPTTVGKKFCFRVSNEPVVVRCDAYLESVRSQMHMLFMKLVIMSTKSGLGHSWTLYWIVYRWHTYLHERKEPKLWVFRSLLEPIPGAGLELVANSIAFNTLVGELALLGCQPAGSQRVVRQCESRADGDQECDCALDDEQPSPTGQAGLVVELINTDCDNACEGGCEDVACVQDRDSGSNFFSCIKYR